jgi:hypothetical protein
LPGSLVNQPSSMRLRETYITVRRDQPNSWGNATNEHRKTHEFRGQQTEKRSTSTKILTLVQLKAANVIASDKHKYIRHEHVASTRKFRLQYSTRSALGQ